MGFINSLNLRSVTPAQQQTLDKLKSEIDRGVKDGTLTSPESQKLYTQLSQLETQMKAPKAGGWFGGAMNAINEQRTQASADQLGKDINAGRTNGEVDYGKLMNSNIGQAAQQIQHLGENIQRGAANGTLSPREQTFLNGKLENLRQTFMNAVGNDGKIDATEMAQLRNMMRGLANDTFQGAGGHHHRPHNPFAQYQPTSAPGGSTFVTKAIPE